ncbi:Piso0_003737 [Millerozyma farinosa CBS 7064]|uniref:Piso0_003737 protein n=1 Tax=Pichia sorbitophila (strain ATCC MYA-4447 / BCRC 22081 / CBS 7064 / NBRC 10061 / NRRL Y-12695) TaxID=559304 RepID=G8YAW1_PICSO|nr:Piso0_003737 [Millerozyma farinosa CBS 7064]CCE84196.1 Piso0_003737 [Millerozyma farinosa CBS 7064]
MHEENVNENKPEEHLSDEEGYVREDEVEEVLDNDNGEEPSGHDMDLDGLQEGETLEIDMSNNSWTYFDKHQDSIFTVLRHPKLPLVASGGGDNTAYLWTTHSQPPKFVGEIEGHKESVISGGFTADGKYLVTTDMSGLVQVHKASKGGEKWVKFGDLEQVDEVLWVSVHPKYLYFAFGALDGSVWVYQIDEASKSLVQLMSGFSHSLECNGGVFVNWENSDENDMTLLTVSEDGSVASWNCFTGALNFKLSPEDEFKGVESPWVSVASYNHMVAIGGRDGQLAIVNNESGKVVFSTKVLENTEDEAELSIEALAWSNAPSVNLLAVGTVSGDMLLFDTLQWRLRRSIQLEDTITKLAFIDNTPFLIGSSMNGKIYKWDARTTEELFVGVGHNMGILDFCIVEGGKKAVTAGDEGVSLVYSLV